MAKHARFGPSSLDALSKCIRFKYSDVDADAAEEGTELHAAVESEDLRGLDDEQSQSVQSILDYVQSIIAGSPDDWYYLKEARVSLEDLTFGTADILLIHKTEPIAHVMDAKFTRMDSDHMFQVRTYGAAVTETLNKGLNILDHDGNMLLKSAELGHGIDTVHTHIVAPRTGNIEVHSFEATSLLEEVRKDIEELYGQIDDPFNPPTPHDELCNKCARASKCPAMNQMVKVAATKLDLTLPETLDLSSINTPEERAVVQVLAGRFKNWADQIKKENNAYAADGGEIPGFKLRSRSNGMRLPKEFTGLAIEMLVNAGYDKNTILESCSLTLGALAKGLAAASEQSQPEIKENIRELLGEFVTESQTQFLQKAKRIDDAELLKQISIGE